MGLKITFRYYLHRKDTEGNAIKKKKKKMVSKWKEEAPNESYIKRLYEVARYSVKHDDFGLFQNILTRLDTTIEREKNSISTWNLKKDADEVIKESAVHYLTMGFFKDLMFDLLCLKWLVLLTEQCIWLITMLGTWLPVYVE